MVTRSAECKTDLPLKTGIMCVGGVKVGFVSDEEKENAEQRCVTAGLCAFHHLAALDRARGDRAYWHPGLACATDRTAYE